MNCLRMFKTVKQRTILKKFRMNLQSSQHPLKFLETEEKFRQMDGVPKTYQLIYKAPMDKTLNILSTYLTFSTTTIACSSVYYTAFVFDKEHMYEPFTIGDNIVIANNSIECLLYLGAFIFFHIAIKILLSKYVIRLYQNGDNYLAIFRGHMYNSIQKHKFTLEEFKQLKPTFVVSWGDARFSLGKKHGILLENYFKTPEHFNYLLYKKKAIDSTVDDDF